VLASVHEHTELVVGCPGTRPTPSITANKIQTQTGRRIGLSDPLVATELQQLAYKLTNYGHFSLGGRVTPNASYPRVLNRMMS